MRKPYFSVAALILASTPALAINGRDDVVAASGGIEHFFDADDAFPEVVSLGGRIFGSYKPYCTGTLIDARTVLSAGHCFAGSDLTGDFAVIAGFGVDGGTSGPQVGTTRVTVHPQFEDGSRKGADLSIVVLDHPIAGPYGRLATQVPVGARVQMIGYGFSGTGSNPTSNDDALRRVVENTLDIYGLPSDVPGADGQLDFWGNDRLIVTDFDKPGDPAYGNLGSTDPLPNEGTTDGGDSGGPLAYRDEHGQLVVVGALSGGITTTAAGLYAGYGDVSYYTPVPDFLDWIAVNGGTQTAQALAFDGDWFDAAHWSGGLVPNNSDFDGVYYAAVLDQQGQTTLDSEATVDTASISGPTILNITPSGRLNSEITTTVSALGSLTVDGRLDSPQLTTTGGRLTGSGLITADIAGADSTIIPGGDHGRNLSVIGSADLTNARLRSRVDADGVSRLQVTGPVTADGLSVGIDLDPAGHSLVGVRGPALTAGTLSGAITVDYAPVGLMAVSATQDANSLDLTVTRIAEYETLARTANDKALARALAGNPITQPGLAGLYDAFDLSDAATVRAGLTGLTGQVAAEGPALAQGVFGPAFERALKPASEMFYRINWSGIGYGCYPQEPPPARKTPQEIDLSEGSGFILTAATQRSQQYRQAGTGEATMQHGFSVFVNGHSQITKSFGIGLTALGGQQSVDLNNLDHASDLTSFGGILTANWQLDQWQVIGAAGLVAHDMNTRRSQYLAGWQTAMGGTQGRSMIGGLSVQRNFFDGDQVKFAPYGSFTVDDTRFDGFSEFGDMNALHYDGIQRRGGNGRLGLSFTYDDVIATYEVSAGLNHRFGDVAGATNAGFLVGGSSFEVTGSEAARNAIELGARYSLFDFVSLEYAASLSDQEWSQRIGGRFKIKL